MSISSDIALFRTKLSAAIDYSMQNFVEPAVIKTTQEAIQTVVYDAYSPQLYERRGYNGGLIDGSHENWDVNYEASTKTLTVQNVNRDDDTGRLVAPVVESGHGYTYIYKMKPRQFHKAAEERMTRDGIFDNALEEGIRMQGFDIKRI